MKRENQFTERDLRGAITTVRCTEKFRNPSGAFGDIYAPLTEEHGAGLCYRLPYCRDLKGREKRQEEGWELVIHVVSSKGLRIVTIPLGLGRRDGYPEIAEAIESFMPIE